MHLSNYSPSDISMYLQNSYGLYSNQPVRISDITYLNKDGEYIEDHDYEDTYTYVIHLSNGEVVELDRENSHLPITPLKLGYRQVGNYVVYFYRKQYRNYKKLLAPETVRTFTPQQAEFSYLNKSYVFDVNDQLLITPQYSTLAKAHELLADGHYSVALHPNYALVKKGKFRNPVIYFKQEPVIESDGTNLTAIIDSCHISKFRMEVPE